MESQVAQQAVQIHDLETELKMHKDHAITQNQNIVEAQGAYETLLKTHNETLETLKKSQERATQAEQDRQWFLNRGANLVRFFFF